MMNPKHPNRDQQVRQQCDVLEGMGFIRQPAQQPPMAASAGPACPFCLLVHGEETLCTCWICDAYVHPHFLHRWVVEGHRVAICPRCAEDPEERSKHKVRAVVLETALREITRTAYDEANRIANHCSDGAARWAMRNLYDAANKAKAVLSPNAQSSATAGPAGDQPEEKP